MTNRRIAMTLQQNKSPSGEGGRDLHEYKISAIELSLEVHHQQNHASIQV